MNWTVFFLHLITNSGATIADLKATVDAVNTKLGTAGSIPDAVIAGVTGAEKALADLIA